MTSRVHSYSLSSLDVCKRQAACSNLQNYTTNDSKELHFSIETWTWSTSSAQFSKNDTDHHKEKQRETLRDAPRWNQLRQRKAKSGFMMHEALKIAQATRDKRITPGRWGNSSCGNGRHTHTESTLTIREYQRTQEEVLQWVKNNLRWEGHKVFIRPSQHPFLTTHIRAHFLSLQASFKNHILTMQSYSRPLRNIFVLTLAKSYIKQDPVVDIILRSLVWELQLNWINFQYLNLC